MPESVIVIEGLDKLIGKLDGDYLLREPLIKALKESGLAAKQEVIPKTPVITSRLRSDIAASPVQLGPGAMPLWAKIGTSVEYGVWVEYGSRPPAGLASHIPRKMRGSKFKGRHMFEKGLKAARGKIEAIFRRAAGEIESRFGK